MKVISKRLASHWRGELVKREFELWKQFKSEKYIVELFYAYATKETFNFVMQFCPGGTLLNLLRKKSSLDPQTAMIYFLELLIVFETIHRENVIYRDLKVVLTLYRPRTSFSMRKAI